MTQTLDLFGETAKPPRKTPQPKGYASRPGSGPKDQTCGSCAHCIRKNVNQRSFFKCALRRKDWGYTRTTDILFRAPACYFWEVSCGEA